MSSIRYFALLQTNSVSVAVEDSAAVIAELHTMLRSASERSGADRRKNAAELVQKTVAGLRGTLSPYLSTPLMSDKAEIDRSIQDRIEFVLQQTAAAAEPLSSASTYRLVETADVPLQRQMVGVMRRLLKNGRSLLAEAGVLSGKNAGTVLLTVCDVSSMDSAASVHDIIAGFRPASDAEPPAFLHDMTAALLNGPVPSDGSGYFVLLTFDAPDAIVDEMKMRVEALNGRYGIRGPLLVKRSFSSGFGRGYTVMFTADLARHPLGSIMLALTGESDALEEAVTTQGALIVMEPVPAA